MAEPIRMPSQQTLSKYGLSVDEWLSHILVVDGVHVCAICLVAPKSGRFVVDHDHYPGWLSMPPERRKRFVRGVICMTCNRFVLSRFSTVLRHKNAAAYLETYQERRDTWLSEQKKRLLA